MSSGFWSFRGDGRSEQDKIASVLEAMPTVDMRTVDRLGATAATTGIADSFEFDESGDDGGGMGDSTPRFEFGADGRGEEEQEMWSASQFEKRYAALTRGDATGNDDAEWIANPSSSTRNDEKGEIPAIELLLSLNSQRQILFAENSRQENLERPHLDRLHIDVTRPLRQAKDHHSSSNVFARLTPALQKTRIELKSAVKIEALRRQREREAKKRAEAETERALEEQVAAERERLRQARGVMNARSPNANAVVVPKVQVKSSNDHLKGADRCVEKVAAKTSRPPRSASASNYQESGSDANNSRRLYDPQQRPPLAGASGNIVEPSLPQQQIPVQHGAPSVGISRTSTESSCRVENNQPTSSLAERIQARALAREDARRLLQEQYEMKRVRDSERAVREAEAEVAVLLNERKKREARLLALRLKNDIRQVEKADVEAREAMRWNMAVEHHKRAILKFHGMLPWRRVLTLQQSLVDRLGHRHAFQLSKRVWQLWRGKTTQRRQVHFACSVLRCVALSRLLWLCFKRFFFLRWRDQIRHQKLLARRGANHFAQKLFHKWQNMLVKRRQAKQTAVQFLEDANLRRFERTRQRYDLHATLRWWVHRLSNRVERRQREQFRLMMERRVVEILDPIKANQRN